MPIAWYAVIIIGAIIIALLLLKKNDKRFGIKFDDILDLAVYVLPISIISARLYYVIFSFDSFKNNLLDIFDIRSGGLAIYGGIIGGIITIIIFCRKRKINTYDILDLIAPYLALGQAIGRWGNFVNIEAYGSQTNNFLRMGIYEGGKYIEVHPTFLYESVANFVIFFILLKVRKNRKIAGEVTYVYIMMYSLIRMIIEGLRTDSLMLFNFRISQILSIVLFVVSLLILTKKVINEKNGKQNIKK